MQKVWFCVNCSEANQSLSYLEKTYKKYSSYEMAAAEYERRIRHKIHGYPITIVSRYKI